MELEKLERILEGIWSGELDHNQKQYTCGTSKCVAGWVFYLEYGMDCPEVGNRTWDEAQEILDVTEAEASLLFDSRATKELHQLILKAFKEGRRLELEKGLIGFSQERKINYLSENLRLVSDEMDEICQFLGTNVTSETETYIQPCRLKN